MAESRALSSFEGTYNSLRDVQKSSNYDYGNGLSKFSNLPYNSKPNRQIMDTKSYLEFLDDKYSKKNKKQQQNDSDSDYEEHTHTPKQALSQVPSKFLKQSRVTTTNNAKQFEFNLPKDLTLSKGPSEQCVPIDSRVLQEMQQKYGSVAQSVIVDQDAKRRFFQLAVDIKNNLPQNHPGQDALVAQMYSECVSKQIPERYWKQWLQTRMEN